MKQNDNEKQRYEAPRLTAVSFRTERGFAGSLDPTDNGSTNGYTNTGASMDHNGSLWSW